MKRSIASLKRRLKLLVVIPVALASACAPALTPGDAAFCSPEYQQLMREHGQALYDKKQPQSPEVDKSADALYSSYEAGCGIKSGNW